MNENEKICPLMSTAEKFINCREDCAWFINDNQVPCRCTMMDAALTLTHIEKTLDDIHIAMPED